MPADFTLHRPAGDDWAAIRDLRIRAVSDTPMAFLETLHQVLALDEQGWRDRVKRNQHTDATQVVAIAPDGRWVGNMVCFVSDGPPSYVVRQEPPGRRANLVGVFVDPGWRGDAGVTDALLGAIATWVMKDRGLDEPYLHVSELNDRARRSYVKRGFRATGQVDTVPDDPVDREIEMVAGLPLVP
jgi:ribosomal protein S18 acetylase RimI-like enzyme